MESKVADRLSFYRSTIPNGKVEIVAVSKFQPEALIREAYMANQRVFGESRVQELKQKASLLPSDIRWHFIGHLQTNKVRELLRIPNLEMIESVDSFRLLEEIDREALRMGKIIHVLMEVHVAREESKFGFDPGELCDWFKNEGYSYLQATHISGVMGMASNTDDEQLIINDFQAISACFRKIKDENADLRGFDILSIGMTHDYLLAVREGSNMVRIGSGIFGER